MQFALALVAPVLVGAQEAPQLSCAALPGLLNSMTQAHYARATLQSKAETRGAERFLAAMDPAKSYLLASEADKFERSLRKVFGTMERGDCRALDNLAALIVKRAAEDVTIVGQHLGPKYKLDDSVTLQLDVDKRGYAKSAKERAARVRKFVEFQVSNQLLTGVELAKAKERVLHRYELTARRISEGRESQDLPGIMAEAFASGLDPHSSYLSARTLADFQIAMRLSLEGIGAALRSEDGYTRIQSVVPGGAADREGTLRPKDKIIAVAQDGEEPVEIIDMDLRDVVQMIRGKKGTKVTLTILREGKGTRTFDLTIVRDKIDVKEQAAKITYQTQTLGKNTYKIGVLELPSFYGGDGGLSAYEDVKRLLAEADKEHVDGLIFDLSENGGGLLNYAVQISGLFMRNGAIVATKSSSGEVEVLSDQDSSTQYSGPLVVLVGPASASASEILAGALKDYGRAVIAGGAQSFGKGTVQQLSGLPGGLGAIKLTMGMFFLPSGASTQANGVRSHVRIPSVYDGTDVTEAALDYALPTQSIPPFISKDANGKSPNERWRPINAAIATKLANRSALRVKKDKVLQEVLKDIAESKDNKGSIRLSELREDAKKNKNYGDEDAAKEAYERKKKAFVEEGAHILVDLIELQKKN